MRTPLSRLTFAACVVSVAIVAPSGPATAQNDASVRAGQLYEAGISLMKAEEYLSAAKTFDKASGLAADPVLVWNAARAYDAAGESRLAIDRYKTFVLSRETEPEHRALALERIVSLEALGAPSGSGGGGAAPADSRPNPGGIDWVTMPAGSFAMGCTGWDRDEQPVHSVTVDGYDIGRTETTVAQYGACVTAGACSEPKQTHRTYQANNWGAPGRDQYPVNGVEWTQATQFCRWAGGRLPTEQEWEYAARSGGARGIYAWGEAKPTCEVAVMKKPFGGPGCGERLTAPVCSRPGGNTIQGLCDTLGNVWEWVSDIYDSQTYKKPPGSKQIGTKHALRGGSYEEDERELRTCNRGPKKRRSRHQVAGFRCVR